MTDNNEIKTICFMCRTMTFCRWQTESLVFLCHPCEDDLESIRAEVVGV